MKLDSAIGIARTLMTETGVGYCRFSFHSPPSERASTVGRAHFAQVGALSIPSKITLGLHWVRDLSEKRVREVILHEIAHLKAGPYVGHGPKWQDECIKLGIAPVAKFKSEIVPAEVLQSLYPQRLADMAEVT